ncbi:hypothetical protein SAMN02745215_04636 [Desulfitobacterium chlororespirans DSM 11544]|uniref:Uncharacterized protein n=1 Tax=Desulfitobacterium chlororespirans DSM 11544 TaxID=1121395 RepID=A0A1M7UTZ9_9FIRM|nr:hypothetical protein SAMN02745215_04636 [Desulfitobacterium chlororespirans DSM 11544]
MVLEEIIKNRERKTAEINGRYEKSESGLFALLQVGHSHFEKHGRCMKIDEFNSEFKRDNTLNSIARTKT